MCDEPATRNDLNEVEQKLSARIDETRADLQQVEQKLSARIDETRADLQQVEQKLSAKIDETRADLQQVEQKLSARIDETRADLQQVEQKLSAKIDENAAKIEKNGRRIDRLTREIVGIHERLDHTLTREEFKEYFDEIIRGQDAIMKIVVRLDQERVSTDARLDRVEADVEKNKRDIREIKTKLAM